MDLSLFIRRPIGTSLFFLAVCIAGAIAFWALPVAPLPKMDLPTIVISGSLPGAGPEVMASSVATPLERRFGRIAGLSEMTSVSMLAQTQVILQFELSRRADSIARDVHAAINAAGGELPVALPMPPTYRKVNPADAPIMVLALTSTHMPLGEMFDYANTELSQRLSQVAGVGQITVGGGQQPAVRISASPLALALRNCTLEDVRNTVAAANWQSPLGFYQSAASLMFLQGPKLLTKAAEYAELIVREQNGDTLRVKDVAVVSDDVENNRAAAWFDNQRAVLMIIRRDPEANMLEAIDGISAVLPFLRAQLPQNTQLSVAVDRSLTLRAAIADVEWTLILTVVLVCLVVLFFLHDIWATLIPSLSVPVSLLGTFGACYLCGYSLNNLSLMAMTIATGFVVDDAIVVTENVIRYLEMGYSRTEAAIKGSKEIFFTVVSMTLSLVAVFIPLLFMQGLIGQLFREFAMTLTLAILISGVVSLTLTPMLCAAWLRPHQNTSTGLSAALDRGFNGLMQQYRSCLHFCLRHPVAVLGVLAIAVAFNVYLLIHIPKGLFPEQDTGVIIGFSESAQDVPFAMMQKRQEEINALVAADEDIQHAVSLIGLNNNTGNQGTLFMALKPIHLRHRSIQQVIAKFQKAFSTLPNVAVYLVAAQDLRFGGRATRTQYQYTLQASVLTTLRKVAWAVFEQLKGLPELSGVAVDLQSQGLEMDVDVDRDQAALHNVAMSTVDDVLYDAYGQRQVSTWYTVRNAYRVVLETDDVFNQHLSNLEQLHLPQNVNNTSHSAFSNMPLQLSQVARFSAQSAPLSINHQSQLPAVTLSFNLGEHASLGSAIATVERTLKAVGLPPGMTASFQGTAKAFAVTMRSEPYLLAAAIICMYIVLGMLYESFVHPITILSTLPSASLGAVITLWFCRMPFDLLSMVGIILLIGIVKKNAIMMVDFAQKQQREHGESPENAILVAAVMRLRPILMTTFTALLGALPLAFGRGTGSELRIPLGVSIAGGLCVSQIVTLLTTPIVYLCFEKWPFKRRRI